MVQGGQPGLVQSGGPGLVQGGGPGLVQGAGPGLVQAGGAGLVPGTGAGLVQAGGGQPAAGGIVSQQGQGRPPQQQIDSAPGLRTLLQQVGLTSPSGLGWAAGLPRPAQTRLVGPLSMFNLYLIHQFLVQ